MLVQEVLDGRSCLGQGDAERGFQRDLWELVCWGFGNAFLSLESIHRECLEVRGALFRDTFLKDPPVR